MVFDLEVSGDRGVEYDISRQRLVGQGRTNVMSALSKAMRDGLRDMGVMDRLAPITKGIIEGTENPSQAGIPDWTRYPDVRPIDDEALLARVEKLVPNGTWPKGLHKMIAQDLSISNNQATRAIGTLLRSGRIAGLRPPTGSADSHVEGGD